LQRGSRCPEFGAIGTVDDRREDLIRLRLTEVDERRPEIRTGVEVRQHHHAADRGVLADVICRILRGQGRRVAQERPIDRGLRLPGTASSYSSGTSDSMLEMMLEFPAGVQVPKLTI
jgi:hypothetical protein